MRIRSSGPRTTSDVKKDFKRDRGIKVGWLTRHRLSFYPEETYSGVSVRVDKFLEGHGIKRLKTDPSKKVSQVPFEEIPDEVLEDKFVKGKTSEVLDLRGIGVFWEKRQAEAAKRAYLAEMGSSASPRIDLPSEDAVRRLLEIIRVERKYFQSLVSKSDVSAEKLFRVLVHGVERFKELGFQAAIFRPIEREGVSPDRCHWQEYSGESARAVLEGRSLGKMLVSIIRSRMSSFKIDINDPSSFARLGLDYDESEVEYGWGNTKGSSEVLIYRLESVARSPEAIIFISNRVNRESSADPPQNLFLPKDEDLIVEELNLYFDTVAATFSLIRDRERRMDVAFKDPDFRDSEEIDNGTLLREIRKNSIPLKFSGVEVLLVEFPSEKLYPVRGALVRAYRDLLLSVYRGSEEYAGCSDEEIIRALSLDNLQEVSRKTFLARYLPVVVGQDCFEGFASGSVEDHVPGVGKVFEVPVIVLRNGAGEKGMLTYLSVQMLLKEFWKRWVELGLIRGIFKMFSEGVILFAWTQSRKVVGAMLELKNLWLPLEGEKVPPQVGRVVEYFSQKHARPVDERLIARDVYKGRIALKDKEKTFKFRRKGIAGLLDKIFRRKFYAKIEQLFEQLGERDAVPVVGNFTIGVALKLSLYIKFLNWYRRWFRKT